MQAQPLLAARSDGVPLIETSHDLGHTTSQARLDETGATFADGTQVCWSALQHVVGDRNGCFEVRGTETTRIQQMSSLTGRLASLYPTQGPPALLLSGTLMHRIKGIHPGEDTQQKLRPLGRLAGMRVFRKSARHDDEDEQCGADDPDEGDEAIDVQAVHQ